MQCGNQEQLIQLQLKLNETLQSDCVDMRKKWFQHVLLEI